MPMICRPHSSPTPATASRSRAGFTAVEIMVVLGIIIALGAMSVGAFQAYMSKSRIDATKYLLQQVVLGMQAYGLERWNTDAVTPWRQSWPAANTVATMWDLNGATAGEDPTDTTLAQHYLDASGDPGFPASPPGAYTGFVKMTGTTIQPRFLRNGDHVVDAWGQRLRVIQRRTVIDPASFNWNAPNRHVKVDWLPDTEKFGVRSDGPDKIPNTADDITSY